MVDVVIPTYDNYVELKECLISLSRQTVLDFQVWIAVDGSQDQTLFEIPKLLTSLPYRACILQHKDEKNHGRAATRNLALPYISREYVWFLDSDMCPDTNCLAAHLSLLKLHGKNAISIGAIEYTNAHKNIWAKYLSTRGHAKYTHNQLLPWNYFITANSILPSKFFVELNGFDENINKYGGEDMELSYRIYKKFAAKLYKNDLALCRTVQEKSLSTALQQLEEYGRYGLSYIYQKHLDMPKVYHIGKLSGNALKRKVYCFLTCSFGRFLAKQLVKYLPFRWSKFFINYLVISAIFRGYSCKK
ncbi:MAG: glycosyltransferase family 2 protein [Bacteroidia bacterium]|nr:glycosyltransferase family 2 protein [Bacteroidia bacterium]MDW8300992.1 glycosyltransferase family 2 protein [Bacteroidia bacterium]